MSEQACDSAVTLAPLFEQFQQRLPADIAAQVIHFSQHYYHTATAEELAERSLENLYGATLSCWQFLQHTTPDQPKLHIYNPDLEQHGWRANHTVIEIIQQDMPFLVDSIRMALNKKGLVIHTVHNAILHTQRKDGQLQALKDGKAKNTAAESVIYLEIDRTSDETDLKALQALLNNVLKYVYAAVADYKPMSDCARKILKELKVQPENKEVCAFIDWLLDDHFTLLGYDEITIKDDQVVLTDNTQLGIFKLEKRKPSKPLAELRQAERDFLLEPKALMFAKDAQYSLVHRPAYIDRVIFKRFDKQGNVVGKVRLHGLYTAQVYTDSLMSIPYVRDKAAAVLKKTGFDPQSHNGKHMMQILNGLPRDEVFLSTPEQLHETAMGIFSLNERRKARLLMRVDRCDQFITFLYFVPRDIFNTELRLQVQDLLEKATGASNTEFTTTFSESVLARVQFVLQIDPNAPPVIDMAALEVDVIKVSRDWSEELYAALNDVCGEEQGNRLLRQYRYAFTSAYREHFSPASSVYDIQRIEALNPSNPIAMSFYRVLEQSSDVLRFKLFTAGEPLVLSDVIPVLENLGMRVVGEHPYSVRRSDGSQFWIHDFTLNYQGSEPVALEEVQDVFQDAFANIWQGRAENDEFNQLVIGANLSWREVAMLRAYARYSQQIRFGFSQPYIAGALSRHIQVTRLLVALFKARFEPGRQVSGKVTALAGRIESSIIDALDKVDNLNEDQILRRFLELIKATLRTSFFQRDEAGELKDYFAFKLSPKEISAIPLPRPMFEVFVYSSRVEGVHLRGGKVARGGLRWSDRLEDYRTEVLGLVKAQQVKNSVIVPVGAKGGFVAKQLPTSGGREAWLNEGIASYKIFISALLDITDNLVAGEVEPPLDVVRHDEDDPYFVVAADKGTATFSDIANEIAESRGFWLGDAFASGGSQGYDHKGMGITARGAWESVKLHFRELGLDTQNEAFSVIGIGDMAGDVFGNGMLLSEHIQLCAAFNHMHIFIDPNPDTAASFKERQRMFELPRSTWDDYNKTLISEGGGIFSRAAKWLDISPQMQQRFAIKESRLAPNDLINALLKAPVDLIWNGGIGTYVKASHESHSEVGDKANDCLRVNGNELRCKVLGEGGNLGFTQQGRIEFCANGGKSNTDFIDNAGGVDCSDHEVNIKILLNEVVANGDLTVKQRNALLRDMTDAVAELVLYNNYQQAQAISLAHSHAKRSMDEYIRLIARLESDGKLDRALEFVPTTEELAERKAQGLGLTRPELSVLISYVKMELKEALIDTQITDDRYLSGEVFNAFPQRLVDEYKEQIEQHRLRREIIATQIANGMVNTMGITFVERLLQMAGATPVAVAAAYIAARDVFGIQQMWRDIEALDNQVASELQQQMMADMIRLMRRATYWFLRQQRLGKNTAATVEKFRPAVQAISAELQQLLRGQHLELWQQQRSELVGAGAPQALADIIAAADSLYSLLSVVEASEQTGTPLDQVTQIYFGLSEHLNLHWFDHQAKLLAVNNHWEAMAREGFREDLIRHQQAITISALRTETGKASGADGAADPRLSAWLSDNKVLLKRWHDLLQDIRNVDQDGYAIFTVAIRGLMELAQAKGKF